MLRKQIQEIPEAFRFSNPVQEAIHRHLLLVGPGPAAFFLDAVRILDIHPPFPSCSHLVMHLFREVESALRDALEPISTTVSGSSANCAMGRDGHKNKVRTILHALDISEEEPVARAWFELVDGGSKLAKRAHRDSLDPPRPLDDNFRDVCNKFELVLFQILEEFEKRYLATYSTLDKLLMKSNPSKGDIDTLRNKVANTHATRRYFFEKLQHPKWLDFLREAGLFQHPPLIQLDKNEGTIAFPTWPESQYLARMARLPEAQEQVLATSLSIPDTENIRVHEDLADVALSLPPRMAAKFIPKIQKWIPSPYYHLLLPEKLGKLLSHLAQGGQGRAAMRLAKLVLAILPGPQPSDQEENAQFWPPELRARIHQWDYETIVQDHVPILVEVLGTSAFPFLCDLLESAMRFSRRGRSKRYYDGSDIWRPAIEAHEQNGPRGLKDLLIIAVRDAAEKLIAGNPPAINCIVQALEKRKWPVFRRIALHLLRCFPDLATDLLVERLTDRKLFHDASVHHEYQLLLKERFAWLPHKSKKSILTWIDEGPPVHKSRNRDRDEPPSEEDLISHKKHWQLDRFSVLEKVLPRKWKQRYEDLLAELGPPEFPPEFLSYSLPTWVGPTSPKSLEELQALAPGELLEYLKNWQAPVERLAPSVEGLGRVLETVIASSPEPFVQMAQNFRELDPTYVRSFFAGLELALKEERTFPWEPVLDLAQWVVSQDREIPGRRGEYADLDPGWVWTRKRIAALLTTGLGGRREEIPFTFRLQIWTILRPLTEDPDPAPENETGGDSVQRMDPAALCINTVRGEAFHAVIQYALWVRRSFEKDAGGDPQRLATFEAMPEVREVLDLHLAPDHDSSPAIRSVYGRYFPWLLLLDREWASNRVQKIFSWSPIESAMWEAAWESYIIFCLPYDDTLEVLREEYGHALERLGQMPPQAIRPQSTDQCLVEHLMVFYWRGQLDLEEPGGLLRTFFAKAPDKLRGHAIRYAGRFLSETPGVSKEAMDRLMRLWENRLQAAQAASAEREFFEELCQFGWWFLSEKLDRNWAFQQLKLVLELAGRVEPVSQVMEKFANLVSDYPREVLQCLASLVERVKESWELRSWRNEIRAILQEVFAKGDAQLRQEAVTLINRLLASGEHKYRDLLLQDAATEKKT